MLYLVTGAGMAAIFNWLWRRQDRAFAQNIVLSTLHPDPFPSRGQGILQDKTLLSKGVGVVKPNILGNWFRLAGIIFVVVVVVWLQPVKLWQENLHPQANREEIAPLVRYVQRHRSPGDLIYVYYFAIYPFKFYYQGTPENIVWGASCHDRCLPLPPERLQQIERLWMIFSHFETAADVDRFIENLLGEGWTRQLELNQPGAVLFCYLPPWANNATVVDALKHLKP
jgi:hypothetical protein